MVDFLAGGGGWPAAAVRGAGSTFSAAHTRPRWCRAALVSLSRPPAGPLSVSSRRRTAAQRSVGSRVTAGTLPALDTGSGTLDTGSGTLDTGSGTLDTGSGTVDTGSGTGMSGQ